MFLSIIVLEETSVIQPVDGALLCMASWQPVISDVFIFMPSVVTASEKNDPPHQLKLALCIVKGDNLDSSCTCVARKVGFGNHISALMLKVCKFALFEAKVQRT